MFHWLTDQEGCAHLMNNIANCGPEMKAHDWHLQIMNLCLQFSERVVAL